MVTAEQVRELLSNHGIVQPQPPDDWTGMFPLPTPVEEFFREVGPTDITIENYGNAFFLPRLAGLWAFQGGYRWDGLTGQAIEGWDDDWLVVADQGGDAFILSRTTGKVLYAQHGTGAWKPAEIFDDLNTMAVCLAHLGDVVASAGEGFTDDACLVRREHRERALTGLRRFVGSRLAAETILGLVGW
jgi:hypothetical protein